MLSYLLSGVFTSLRSTSREGVVCDFSSGMLLKSKNFHIRLGPLWRKLFQLKGKKPPKPK